MNAGFTWCVAEHERAFALANHNMHITFVPTALSPDIDRLEVNQLSVFLAAPSEYRVASIFSFVC